MSIKVVDLQNEAVKEEAPTLEPIEEAKEEEQPELVNEVDEEPIEQPKEEVKEQLKEEVKEETKPKRQTQKDRIQCPKCLKEVSLKTYRYSHEKNCGGQLSEKPVKPHAKPKAKQTAKPKPKPPPDRAVGSMSWGNKAPPEIYYSDEEEEVPTQPLIKKKQPVPVQPINPVDAVAQHYLVLQQQFIKQKQEKYNNLCMNMFSSKTKRR